MSDRVWDLASVNLPGTPIHLDVCGLVWVKECSREIREFQNFDFLKMRVSLMFFSVPYDSSVFAKQHKA
jgi:hypothetical protein